MEIKTIRVLYKYLRINFLWLAVALLLASIITLLSLIFSNLPSLEKLTHGTIVIVLNLLVLFINYLFLKNNFTFAQIYYQKKNDQTNIDNYYISKRIFFISLVLALTVFFIVVGVFSKIMKINYASSLSLYWPAACGYGLWMGVTFIGFMYLNWWKLNKIQK